MHLKLCLYALSILNICYNFNYATETCPIKECTCDSATIVCTEVNSPLNLSAFDPAPSGVSVRDSNITGTIFAGEQNVSTLTFDGCRLVDLGPDAFKNVRSLKVLDVKKSVVNVDDVDLKENKLERLSLVECGFRQKDMDGLERLLAQVPTLQELDLSGNEFDELDTAVLSPLKELKKLNVAGNALGVIRAGRFESRLEEVDLSNNLLANVSARTFESSRESLERLFLENNRLTRADMNFSDFKKLKSLRLGSNSLECSCSWMEGLNVSIVEPGNLRCDDPVAATTDVSFSEFLAGCSERKEAESGEGGSNSSLVVVVVFLVVVLVAAVVGCFVHRILSNRRRRAQEKKAVRYSAVYRETVETSAPSSRTTMDTKA